MSDFYESMSRTPIRDALKRLSSVPWNSFIRHSGEGRNPEGRGLEDVVRSKTSRGEGLVPRWGRGGTWQNPPCQFAVPSHSSSFSYLGVPAPAGMSDYYESMSRTTIRASLPNRHSGDRKHAPYSDTGPESRGGGIP